MEELAVVVRSRCRSCAAIDCAYVSGSSLDYWWFKLGLPVSGRALLARSVTGDTLDSVKVLCASVGAHDLDDVSLATKGESFGFGSASFDSVAIVSISSLIGCALAVVAFAVLVAGAYACRGKLGACRDAVRALVTCAAHSYFVRRSLHVCNGFVWNLAPGKLVNGKNRHPIATRCRAAVCGDKSVCCAHVSQLSHEQPPCIGWRIPDNVLQTSNDIAMARVVAVWSTVVRWVSGVPTAVAAFTVQRSRQLVIVGVYAAVMFAIHVGFNMVVTIVLYAMLGGVAWKLMLRKSGVKWAVLGVFVAGVLLFAASPMFDTSHVHGDGGKPLLGRADLEGLPTTARAYNASRECDSAYDGSVVGLVDSGSTHHITTREEYLINVHSREHARLDGMGSTLTTAIGDTMAVFARNANFTQFTAPKMLTNTLCAPHQDHTLLSESALEADGIYRDTVNRRMFFSDAIDGEQTNTVPLGSSVSGRNRKLYPVNMVFLMADGRPHDSDCTVIADAYRAFLDQQTVSPSSDPADNAGSSRSQTQDDGRAYVASRADEPFTFVDGFGGYASISRVLGLAGHIPVAYFDAIRSVLLFRRRQTSTPLCAILISLSRLGVLMWCLPLHRVALTLQLESNKVIPQQMDDDMLRTVSPRVHVVETVSYCS